MSAVRSPAAAVPVGHMLHMSVVGPEPVYNKWEISDFKINDWKTGQKLSSPVISINETKWQISLYTKGINDSSNQYLSIILVSLNTSAIKAIFSFSILDDQNEVAFVQGTKVIFRVEKPMIGFVRFIKQYILINPDSHMLTNSKLAILCKIIVNTNSNQQQNNVLYKTGNLSDFETFLNNEKFSDVKFIVDGREFYAHKIILSKSSEIFAAMFEHDMKENLTGTVVIKDISCEIFMEMFSFVYSGKVNNIEKIAESLYVAADKYALGELMSRCVNYLCSSLSTNNAVERLQFAVTHGVNKLKVTAIDFIALHIKDIVNTPGFQLMKEIHGDTIIEVFQRVALQKG